MSVVGRNYRQKSLQGAKHAELYSGVLQTSTRTPLIALNLSRGNYNFCVRGTPQRGLGARMKTGSKEAASLKSGHLIRNWSFRVQTNVSFLRDQQRRASPDGVVVNHQPYQIACAVRVEVYQFHSSPSALCPGPSSVTAATCRTTRSRLWQPALNVAVSGVAVVHEFNRFFVVVFHPCIDPEAV